MLRYVVVALLFAGGVEAQTIQSAAWGTMTGALADQTDLQSALDGKAAASHTHAAAEIASGALAGARGGLGAAQPTCAGGAFLTCNGSTCSCSTPAGSNPWSNVVSTSDASESTAAADTTIAGLTIPVSASTNYLVRCYLTTGSAATTTGVQITLSGPASPTQLTWSRTSCSSTAANAYASLNAYSRDARTASAGTTRCIDQITANIRNGANAGNVTLAVRSEIAASAVTVYTGSYCEYRSY